MDAQLVKALAAAESAKGASGCAHACSVLSSQVALAATADAGSAPLGVGVVLQHQAATEAAALAELLAIGDAGAP